MGCIVNRINDENNNVYILREDLLPFSFGGNKARKGEKFFQEILKEKATCVVTYGSKSSNHCRVVANYCSKYNLKCEIITPITDNENNPNTQLVKFTGANINLCQIEDVKTTIEKVIAKNNELGYKTFFIPGGGHSDFGTEAYVDAFDEISKFSLDNNIKFDYIFHASGTGTTQAGLIVGKYICQSDIKIVGISIAREKSRGANVVYSSVIEYCENKKLDLNIPIEEVIFIDDYLQGGYGKYNKEIVNTINQMYLKEGIPLDTTYTGKAYYGMEQYINKNDIKNKNILFIHTGGTPLFFNQIKEN